MISEKNKEEPLPPRVGRPDGLAPNLRGAPDDVRFGVWAWLSVSSMQALYAIVNYVANVVDPRALRSQIKEELESVGGMGKAFAQLSVEEQASMMNISMTLWVLFAAGLCAYLASRAGRGGTYSRILLNVGSLYLVLQAVLLLFSSPPATMPVGFVLILGILSILSGVVAAVGMYFMSRPGNAEWLGIPPISEFERYAQALERRKKERREKKQGKDSTGKDKHS